jgi:hypothetical protein
MQMLVLIGSSVSEVGQVKVRHFPFKRYMAYNNLHSTTVHAVIERLHWQQKPQNFLHQCTASGYVLVAESRFPDEYRTVDHFLAVAEE